MKKPTKVWVVEEGVEYGVCYKDSERHILNHYTLVTDVRGRFLIIGGFFDYNLDQSNYFVKWDTKGNYVSLYTPVEIVE